MKNRNLAQLVLAFMVLGVSSVSLAAKPVIRCRGISELGLVSVLITDKQVQIQGAELSSPRVFSRIFTEYDGGMTTLITAPGLALSYETHFGKIMNARLTTNLRTQSGVRKFIEHVELGSCDLVSSNR